MQNIDNDINSSNEVEVKCRVVDKKSLLDILHKKARYKRKYFKKDFYYSTAKNNDDFDIDRCIRLRLDRGSYTFTSKSRIIENGIEFNDERNLSVTRHKSKVIVNFIKDILNMSLYVLKEKKGKAFVYKNTLIEVSTIKGLGDFVEFEIIDSSDNLDATEKIEFLKDLINEFGISESDIETKTYIEMIKAAEKFK